MQLEPVREVSLDQWGKAVLEELLFRAAQRVSDGVASTDCVEVALSFRITPDVAAGCLEISTDAGPEPPLVTRLARPF